MNLTQNEQPVDKVSQILLNHAEQMWHPELFAIL